jgi:D-beta-D-heptose 7-phosphate kinase/D-beta-D-heptose 1-phosphate adenosyltransferase
MNIQVPKKFKILLIGDNCTDVYQYGDITRLSPEAPVPVFVPTHKEERDGMAGNVYANLTKLGCTVDLLSGPKSIKTRLIENKSKQQILRIDEDPINEPIQIDSIIPDIYNAVVFSDYGKGIVDYSLIDSVIKSAHCPVFIDTKKTDLAKCYSAWVKINQTEAAHAVSICPNLIVTLGEDGARLRDTVFPTISVEVSDVTGAGDTFLAALVYKYLETEDITQAIPFANRASAVTVQHYGVYAPTLEEIYDTNR